MSFSFSPNRIHGVLLIGITLLVYSSSFSGRFLWDDDTHIVQEECLRSLDGLRRIWVEPGATCQYYPLTFTFLWIQYQAFGDQPLGYRLVNVGLHVSVALLLAFLLVPRLGPGWGWGAAWIFALHPIQVMSVAWVTEIKNTGSALIGLLSIAAFLHGEARDENRWRWWTLLLFLLAMLAKTSSVVIPLFLLLWFYWRDGEVKPATVQWLLPMILLGMLISMGTVLMEQTIVYDGDAPASLSMLQRATNLALSMGLYLRNFLWPVHLSFLYPPLSNLPAWLGYAALTGLLTTLLAAFEYRHQRGRGAFCWLLAFLVGGPVLALFPPLYMMQYTPISDHWIYWGMIPLSIGIAWIYSQRRLRPSYKRILGPLLILIMAALTFHRARDFQSEEQVWLQTIERNPQAHLALHNLGLSALTQGRTAEAIRYLEQALEVAPQVGRVRMNLGVAYERAGRTGDAISTYQSLITLRPDMADPYRPLLSLLIARGDQAAADELMHQMIRHHPEWMTPKAGGTGASPE
ncbi:MAG: tetratricopeptide repeat protein [Kiritimatiellae bacterium]|nr:tetratricopeptide repeat protein [Kiritimatiellia bacterium]